MFALVDVNNFYASCEQLFDPMLRDRPIVVLSNNDGCAVSRSAEARALGIPMGAPWHQWRARMRPHGVVALSSNYTLYADMSDRVVEVLSAYTPEMEVYSIDESFLDVSGCRDRLKLGLEIRERIWTWLGLAVCVGIGPTKTLAKLANHAAKKRPQFGGVCDLDAMPTDQRDALLADIEVGEVWGVGRRLRARLEAMDIRTVAALRDADVQTIRDRFGVVLERTVRELRGTSCLNLELVASAKQQIICSRTFGGYIQDIDTLRAAVSTYTARAAEKLRAQDSVAGSLQVFIQTNPFREKGGAAAQYQRGTTIPLPDPTADTMLLVQWALRGLDRIFRPGFDYRKAGIMLGNFSPADRGQLSLLSGQDGERRSRLNSTMDRINRRWGKGTARVMVEAIKAPWAMARGSLSPAYTTEWAGVPVVMA